MIIAFSIQLLASRSNVGRYIATWRIRSKLHYLELCVVPHMTWSRHGTRWFMKSLDPAGRSKRDFHRPSSIFDQLWWCLTEYSLGFRYRQVQGDSLILPSYGGCNKSSEIGGAPPWRSKDSTAHCLVYRSNLSVQGISTVWTQCSWNVLLCVNLGRAHCF